MVDIAASRANIRIREDFIGFARLERQSHIARRIMAINRRESPRIKNGPDRDASVSKHLPQLFQPDTAVPVNLRDGGVINVDDHSGSRLE